MDRVGKNLDDLLLGQRETKARHPDELTEFVASAQKIGFSASEIEMMARRYGLSDEGNVNEHWPGREDNGPSD